MSECDICGREKGPVPPLCGRDRPGASFPDMADCYSTGFYRLKREGRVAGEQVDALVADARAAYPVCTECGEDIIPHDGEVCGACAKSEFAAAEERGRRRGVEEAAKAMRDVAATAVAWAVAAGGSTPLAIIAKSLREKADALSSSPPMSPSAEKYAHSAECGGQPAGSGCICGVGFGAPRDSGKEEK